MENILEHFALGALKLKVKSEVKSWIRAGKEVTVDSIMALANSESIEALAGQGITEDKIRKMIQEVIDKETKKKRR